MAAGGGDLDASGGSEECDGLGQEADEYIDLRMRGEAATVTESKEPSASQQDLIHAAPNAVRLARHSFANCTVLHL